MSKEQFTKDAFLAWAKTMHPEQEYDFFLCQHCACGLYAQTLGMQYRDLPIQFVIDMEVYATPSKYSQGLPTFGRLVRRMEKKVRRST